MYNIASTERERGNFNEARTQIEAAIKIVESLRTKVLDQELRTSYFASVQKFYQFYKLHKHNPAQGYNALALLASERARACSLVDLLIEANADIRQGVDPKLLVQERTLQQKLDAIEKRRFELPSGKYTNAQTAALEKENSALRAQYQQIEEQIRQTSPGYAALTQPSPLSLAQMQKLLDPNTVLLEYSLGEKRSYLWALTKSAIASYELPNSEEIEKAARRFYQLVTDRRYSRVKQDLAQVSASLSQIILAPVAGQLSKKRLVIVSDGALQYIPFTALPVPTNSKLRTVEPLLEHRFSNQN